MSASSGHLAGKRDCAGAQVSLNDAVDQPELQGFCSIDWFSRNAHVDCGGDADEPRKPLSSFSAWNDPQVDLGLPHLRVRRRNSIMCGHCQFHSTAECRPVKSNDNGSRAVTDLL